MTFWRASGAALLMAAMGCVSVPPDVQADMEPPDGARPNNYGRLEETPGGGPDAAVVRPDRPTVLAAGAER